MMPEYKPEFVRAVQGWDRCDECGQMAALVWIYNTNIDPVLLEIYDNGKPELVCYGCWEESGMPVHRS